MGSGDRGKSQREGGARDHEAKVRDGERDSIVDKRGKVKVERPFCARESGRSGIQVLVDEFNNEGIQIWVKLN